MQRKIVDCCPECGRVAEDIESGAGSGSSAEIVSNVQLSVEQMKKIAEDERKSQSKKIDDMLKFGEAAEFISKTLNDLIRMSIDDVSDDDRDYATPSVEFLSARDLLLSHLMQLQNILDSQYIDDQRDGRPLVRKWISATTPMQKLHVFRRHLPDEVDETGIEVVGLLDQSGSMGGMIDHASQATWAIASAVRLSNNACTMIGFDDDAYMLIGRKQELRTREYPIFGVRGGTNPVTALNLAKEVFAASDMPNRLLYIVTDGEWFEEEQAVEIINGIRKEHMVDSILVEIGYSSGKTRGCDYVVSANNPSDMCDQISKVIIEISRRAAMRIATETNREV